MKADEFPRGFFFPEQTFHLIFPSMFWYMMIWPVLIVILFIAVMIEIVKFAYLASKAVYGFVVEVRKEMKR